MMPERIPWMHYRRCMGGPKHGLEVERKDPQTFPRTIDLPVDTGREMRTARYELSGDVYLFVGDAGEFIVTL